jgi:hypothetical protein
MASESIIQIMSGQTGATVGDEVASVRDWATFGLGTLSKTDTASLRDALVEPLSDDDADMRKKAIRGLALRKDVRGGTRHFW